MEVLSSTLTSIQPNAQIDTGRGRAACRRAWVSSRFFRNIELDTYDLRVAATARPAAPSGQIVLVAIDNESLRRMEPLVGRWPWPRLVHATLIDYLAAAGAKVIAYDVLFAERDIRKFMVGRYRMDRRRIRCGARGFHPQGRQRRPRRRSREHRAGRSVAGVGGEPGGARAERAFAARRLRRTPAARDAAISSARAGLARHRPHVVDARQRRRRCAASRR